MPTIGVEAGLELALSAHPRASAALVADSTCLDRAVLAVPAWEAALVLAGPMVEQCRAAGSGLAVLRLVLAAQAGLVAQLRLRLVAVRP